MESVVDTLNNFYCKAFPIKIKYVSPIHHKKPWFTPRMKELMESKSLYFQLFKLNIVSLSENNQFRNKVNSVIRKTKKIYFQTLFVKNANDMKKTWATINNLLSKNCRHKCIRKVIVNDVVLTEDMDIANAFNDFFCSVGRNLDNSIPLSSIDPLRYINVNSSSFFLQPVSPLEISYHIKKLKNSKQDLNTISIEILKDSCNGVLSLVLSDVINFCFEKGVFPNSLKKAIVLPLYKKGDQATLSNYRPISILPTMSKLVEKCLKTRLMNYLTDFNLINPVQFGFQANVSTQDAILHVIEKIYSNLDKKVSTMAVFIDFSKSFDTINIPIALKKL